MAFTTRGVQAGEEMAKSFTNGVSLHRLLETAPLPALQAFLTTIDNERYAGAFRTAQWNLAQAGTDAARLRTELIAIANALAADAAVPLDRHAQRILTLAEGRGSETIQRVAAKLFEQTHIEAFAAQLDALARSLWLYLHQPQLFDEAETLFYVDHYRNFGRLYEAFEVDGNLPAQFPWDATVKEALEQAIQTRLELTGRCTVTHLRVDPRAGAAPDRLQHLLIVRHGGPLSSVAEYLKRDGNQQKRYN